MIVIQTTPLSYRIQVAANGQLFGTNLYLSKYLKRFNHTKWDKRLRRSILYRRYIRYDEKTQTLYAPRYDLPAFCQYLQSSGIAYTTEQLPLQIGAEINVSLKSHIRDRNEQQTAAINYLTTCSESQRGLSSMPGFGKTFCAVKSIAILGRRTMICVAGLIEQWQNAILEYTELSESDVYIIQGAVSINKLLLQIDKTLFPKIIICSLGTIRAYSTGDAAYENHPPFVELFDRLRVGVKVVDEAHLNFYLTLMIDLQTNAAVNIALTATFDRGDYQVKQIFDSHYPHLMRFGENVLNRYVDIYSYNYSLGNMIPAKAYLTSEGYNHSKLEEYLMRRVPKHLEYIYKFVYSPAIYAHYINKRRPGQRLLILCTTVAMCTWLHDKLVAELSPEENFKVALYTYESSIDVLSEADIVISTPGSAGTGTDIKDLLMVLMTIATGSENTNKQSLGRLRELSNGDTPVYAYSWNRDLSQHQKYQEARRHTYTARGKSFHEIVL